MLVAARLVLGRGGALAVALGYLGFRVGVAVFVGWGIDHTAPHVPLHLVSAAAVEAVGLALGVARRLRFVAVSGLALATVGLAGERAWVGAVAPHSWGDGLLPDLLLPGGLAAVGGASWAAPSGDWPPAPVPSRQQSWRRAQPPWSWSWSCPSLGRRTVSGPRSRSSTEAETPW